MKMKRGLLLVYSLNILRSFKISIGLNSIQIIQLNLQLMVRKECSSYLGNMEFQPFNIIHHVLRRKTFQTRIKQKLILQRQFLFQIRKWQLLVLMQVIFLFGTDHLLLKVLANKTKKDLLKLSYSTKTTHQLTS